MTDEPKAYFTRDGDLVRIRTNPNFCAEGREPLDIKIDTEGEFRGISHETLWHAGAGILEISTKGKWKITEISEDQGDDIYSLLSHEDDCIWGSYWDDFCSRRYAFVKDYETSQANSRIPADYEEYAIVNDHVAIKVGSYNKRPIRQIFDCELGVWVDNSNGVYNLIYEDDPDDAWGWPPKDDDNNIKLVSKEKVEAHIANEQKERHLKITDFSVSTSSSLPLPLDTYLAGTSAYQAEKVRHLLSPGDKLKLCLEPTNRFDRWAIEVFTFDDIKLGYVPRVVNKPYVALMDKGHEVFAEIISVETDRDGDIEIRLSPGGNIGSR